MTPEEIAGEYELNTGKVIVETFEGKDPDRMHAVLVNSHAPFTWGKDAKGSVEAAVVLEQVAMMALHTEILARNAAGAEPMQEELLRKHFDRKHGPNAYYGQAKK